ncbi:CHC2 zinc finger domain-containing protein [Lentzea sp. NBRC 105346]|uniref:CHC2 zinc finger domain-containing protein n=1 Tax=Lentzea sp. NBRC 105346 TaxID=3032205 RepID=UPI002556C797|nr:CHC2 zinc finger domain-containing protein [Lentzea sp. NBRC 105346]
MATVSAADPGPNDPDHLLALVRQHTLLVPECDDSWRGLCPFCRSTAFHVRPLHGTFHCFRCGVGGGTTRFAAMIENS